MQQINKHRLTTEWLACFPRVALNLVQDSTGDWLCWCVLRRFGTVLWRQYGQPSATTLVQVAHDSAHLPRSPEGLIPHNAAWMHGSVNLKDLEKRLQEAKQDELEALSKPIPRMRKGKETAAHYRRTLFD